MSTRPPRRESEPSTATLRLEDASPLHEQVARSVREEFRPALVVMNGTRVGEKISLLANLCLVGRSPEADITFTDAGISWEHARLEDRGGSWAVIDLESTNGTIVNGDRVRERELEPGDKLVFGTTMVRFEVRDSADQAYDAFLDKLLNIDDLTGLYLRRRFDAELRSVVERASAADEPVAMLVMDLDGLKAINDTHGHPCGAYAIAETGKLIGQAVKGRGFACRWGGDEYLAALPGVTLELGVAIGEEILSAVREHHYERDGVVLRPGISIGVSVFPLCAPTPEALFEAADAALYRAKRAGKNCVST